MTNVVYHHTNQDLGTTVTQAWIDERKLCDKMVAVYCGSRIGDAPIYADEANLLGVRLAQTGYGLVYGAGSVGIMGAVSQALLKSGGRAVGVIPNFLTKKELPQETLTVLHITDTMHTRKSIMAMYADAFITLAGGFGTLEEIAEIATWHQLQQHKKPMIILNTQGFYNPLIAQIQHMTEKGFMSALDRQSVFICDTVDEVMQVLTRLVPLA